MIYTVSPVRKCSEFRREALRGREHDEDPKQHVADQVMATLKSAPRPHGEGPPASARRLAVPRSPFAAGTAGGRHSARATEPRALRGTDASRPVARLPAVLCRSLRYLFTDIDDTLTTDGMLPDYFLRRLWDLCRGRGEGRAGHGKAGGLVRSHRADVAGGGRGRGKRRVQLRVRQGAREEMKRDSSAELRLIAADRREVLMRVAARVLREVPGTALAADQPFRISDVAIDYCEDVPRSRRRRWTRSAASWRTRSVQLQGLQHPRELLDRGVRQDVGGAAVPRGRMPARRSQDLRRTGAVHRRFAERRAAVRGFPPLHRRGQHPQVPAAAPAPSRVHHRRRLRGGIRGGGPDHSARSAVDGGRSAHRERRSPGAISTAARPGCTP